MVVLGRSVVEFRSLSIVNKLRVLGDLLASNFFQFFHISTEEKNAPHKWEMKRKLNSMSMMFTGTNTQFDVESMADYEGISERFIAGFHSFAEAKKLDAVKAVLKSELTHETLITNPDFINEVLVRVDDEALQEK